MCRYCQIVDNLMKFCPKGAFSGRLRAKNGLKTFIKTHFFGNFNRKEKY